MEILKPPNPTYNLFYLSAYCADAFLIRALTVSVG